MIAEVDPNSDGKVSFEEFSSLMKGDVVKSYQNKI